MYTEESSSILHGAYGGQLRGLGTAGDRLPPVLQITPESSHPLDNPMGRSSIP